MNQLQLLHSLETIRDLLGPVVIKVRKDFHFSDTFNAVIEAHRSAHYACEATYASLEEEAHAMTLAQGAADMDDYNSDWSKKVC